MEIPNKIASVIVGVFVGSSSGKKNSPFSKNNNRAITPRQFVRGSFHTVRDCWRVRWRVCWPLGAPSAAPAISLHGSSQVSDASLRVVGVFAGVLEPLQRSLAALGCLSASHCEKQVKLARLLYPKCRHGMKSRTDRTTCMSGFGRFETRARN